MNKKYVKYAFHVILLQNYEKNIELFSEQASSVKNILCISTHIMGKLIWYDPCDGLSQDFSLVVNTLNGKKNLKKKTIIIIKKSAICNQVESLNYL